MSHPQERFQPSAEMQYELLRSDPADKLRSATDLYGELCKKQPKENEIPILEADKPSQGCTFQSFDNSSQTGKPGQDQMPPLDTIALYRHASQQAVRIQTLEGYQGSGVIIGEVNNKIVIATDYHVLNPYVVHDNTIGPGYERYTVTMPDSSSHTAYLSA